MAYRQAIVETVCPARIAVRGFGRLRQSCGFGWHEAARGHVIAFVTVTLHHRE